jgi:hypothetical protein
LQQDALVKIENNVDVMSEEDYSDMKSNRVYTLSPFSIENPEPKVSVIIRCSWWQLLLYISFFLH